MIEIIGIIVLFRMISLIRNPLSLVIIQKISLLFFYCIIFVLPVFSHEYSIGYIFSASLLGGALVIFSLPRPSLNLVSILNLSLIKLFRVEYLSSILYLLFCLIIVLIKVNFSYNLLLGYLLGARMNYSENVLSSNMLVPLYNSIFFIRLFIFRNLMKSVLNQSKSKVVIFNLVNIFGLFLVYVTRLEIGISFLIMLISVFRIYKFKIRYVLSAPIILGLHSFLDSVRSVGFNNANITLKSLAYGLSRDISPSIYFDKLFNTFPQDLDFEYGRSYWDAIISFIPRFIWLEKPITSFDVRMTHYFDSLYFDSLDSIMVFTVLGDGYANFGLIGIFINVAFFLFFQKIVIKSLQFKYLDFFNGIYLLVLFSSFMRASLNAVIFKFIFLIVAINVYRYMCNKLKI